MRFGSGATTRGDNLDKTLTNFTIHIFRAKNVLVALFQREFFQGNFGKVSDQEWAKLVQEKFLSRKDAPPRLERFPLLVGMRY